MSDEAQTETPIPDDQTTVFEAWSRVMDEVQAISKDSRNSQQGFNFRGIDAVMNVVGPALRKHGVVVVPRATDEESERYETAPKGNQQRGTAMVNRLVKVEFTVFGPGGDSFTGATYGEAADSGDKAMAKAHSVAYRTFLLQALTIPTDEPDPDSEAHERAPEQPQRQSRERRQKSDPPSGDKPKLPEENAEGRAALRAFCEENGLDPQVIAGQYISQNPGQSLATADNETIRAYITLLSEGMVPSE